jgi:hypothetical protein
MNSVYKTYFLFDEPKSPKIFKISLTFRFDIGENSQILTVTNKKRILIYVSNIKNEF